MISMSAERLRLRAESRFGGDGVVETVISSSVGGIVVRFRGWKGEVASRGAWLGGA